VGETSGGELGGLGVEIISWLKYMTWPGELGLLRRRVGGIVHFKRFGVVLLKLV